MDLREKKTKRNIRNAFISLRSQKPLERITVKELAELAEISKATFYLHYHDLYDLSEQLQKEVILDVLKSLEHPDLFLTDNVEFVRSLFYAFHAQQTLIDILFSGSQFPTLSVNIEAALKEHIFQRIPEERDNIKFQILLTYQILGGFHVYQQYHKLYDIDYIMNVIADISNIPYPKLD